MNKKSARLMESFRWAVYGLADAWQKERNMKIHSVATFLVLAAGLWLRLERVEWLFILSAVFLVFTMEMLNTSLERVVDLFTREYHPLAGAAKNAAAGAALLASLYALLVAGFILLPRLAERINIF
ncbi:MAG: diacylglycerol kinase family protein [Clostridiales bacterium]|jgi:diacylglycerol kinase|nr:diacylglycerol kinase family protein [Clostridiales bacterium]